MGNKLMDNKTFFTRYTTYMVSIVIIKFFNHILINCIIWNLNLRIILKYNINGM